MHTHTARTARTTRPAAMAASLLAGALLALLLAGCRGTGNAATPVPPGEPAADPVVTIADMAFVDGAVTVEVGTEVTWNWADAPIEHNVVFDDVESPLQAEGTWTRTFDEVGEFPYHCGPHPMMKGIVEVVPAP